jgi:hypothetical protein
MNSELVNYKDNSSSNERVDRALDKFIANLEVDLGKLHRVSQQPSGQGEVDAFLGIAASNEDPSYKASYERVSAILLLASKEEQQLITLMRPEVRRLLKEKAT